MYIQSMGKILLSLDEETEKKFRELTIRLYGNKKGALSIAGEMAFQSVSGQLRVMYNAGGAPEA